MDKRIEEYSFRELVNHYVLITNVGDRFRLYNMQFQCLEGDNALLTYGYIDHEAGLTFEVLCFANIKPSGHVELRPGNPNTTVKIRYDGMVENIAVVPYDISMAEYADKVRMVKEGYRYSDELEEIRKYEALDGDRDAQFPDDVLTVFIRNGINPEKMWVRTEKIIDGKVAGILLNESYSSAFGVHKGDIVRLVSVPVNNGRMTVADTPDLYA